MTVSHTEYYTELSDMLSYRDRQPAVFANLCNVLDRCLRFRGLLPAGAPAINAATILDLLERRRFCSFCVCPHSMQPLGFVWGRVELHHDTILLGVDHQVCSTCSEAERQRNALRVKTMRDHAYTYAITHFGMYPLDGKPQVVRKKVYWICNDGGVRKSILLRPE